MTTTFGPYSAIRWAGSSFFVSGQVGVDPATKHASSDVADQTRQALTNMKSVVESAGMTMNDVVKTTIFVHNIDDFAAINSVYETFFEPPRPARSTVEVAALPRLANTPLLVEIEAVGYRS